VKGGLSKLKTAFKLLFSLGLFANATLLPTWAASSAPSNAMADFQIFRLPAPANELKMLDLNGRSINLSDMKGRVVLLNFWRKDCPYCEREKVYLRKVIESVNSPYLKVVCANFWDSPSAIRNYLGRNRRDLLFAGRPDNGQSVIKNEVRGRIMGYYVVNGAGEAIYEIKGFPSTYIIDKQGKLVASHLGMAKWNAFPVQRFITALVNDSSGFGDSDYELPQWIDLLLSRSVRLDAGEGVSRNRAEVARDR
jgi:peroxiredoxin